MQYEFNVSVKITYELCKVMEGLLCQCYPQSINHRNNRVIFETCNQNEEVKVQTNTKNTKLSILALSFMTIKFST